MQVAIALTALAVVKVEAAVAMAAAAATVSRPPQQFFRFFYPEVQFSSVEVA